jgi:DNA-binding LacI/PurR family transcriptional regulator
MTTDTPPRRAVMADVAARAGVSVMTVSRVLNGFAGVADETRRRVEEAVVALGYQANTAARVLAGGRSRTLGVMAVETEQFGPSHMLFGIEAAAREAGHLLSFVTLSKSGSDMASTLHRLRASHVQGVIVVAPVKRVVEAVTHLDGDMPLVVVGGDPAIGTPTVTIDATARLRGWSEALRTYPAERGTSVAGDWGARKGYDAGTRLARDPTVTAVFAANDQTALGVIRGLHDAGRRVPEDVSVVGFDATPESGYFLPPLTTIRQDFGEVGRRSVELLLTLLDGRPAERHIIVPAVLVPRASTAPPP